MKNLNKKDPKKKIYHVFDGFTDISSESNKKGNAKNNTQKNNSKKIKPIPDKTQKNLGSHLDEEISILESMNKDTYENIKELKRIKRESSRWWKLKKYSIILAAAIGTCIGTYSVATNIYHKKEIIRKIEFEKKQSEKNSKYLTSMYHEMNINKREVTDSYQKKISDIEENNKSLVDSIEERLRKTAEEKDSLVSRLDEKYNSLVQQLNQKDEIIKKTEERLRKTAEEKDSLVSRLDEKYTSLVHEVNQKDEIIQKKEKQIHDYSKANSLLDDKLNTSKHSNITENNITENKHLAGKQIVSKSYIKDKEYYYFPVRNDTLSKISSKVSGDISNWSKIQKYNNLSSTLIEVNQPLKIPRDIVYDDSHLFKGSLGCRIYRAGSDDSLNSISKKIYGSDKYADRILAYNKTFNPRFSERIWPKEYILLPD